MIERILVGTDGSEVADNAFSAALRLAKATGAEVRVLHAIESPTTYVSPFELDPSLEQERRQAREKILEDLRQRGADVDVPVRSTLSEGSPSEVMLAEAASWPADLIAIGRQGMSRLQRTILGSVADRLVRGSPVPVLTIRDPPQSTPPASLGRILVPSDGSEAALAALPFALELAEATGAGLDLLYAIPPELEGGKYLDRPADEVDKAHEQMANRALDPLEERCAKAGVSCRRFVLHDPPHKAIVQHATGRDADMIVMATRGHGGLQRLLVGSVTSKVLRTASTPVVTIRPPDTEE